MISAAAAKRCNDNLVAILERDGKTLDAYTLHAICKQIMDNARIIHDATHRDILETIRIVSIS